MFVEQNLCAPNSITNQLNQPPLVFLDVAFDFSCQKFNGGLTLDSLRVSGVNAKRTIFGTTMRVDLAKPLAPGASVHTHAAWEVQGPDKCGGWNGRERPLLQI